MREIDKVHDAENERQSRRQQEQQQSELQPVQKLFDDKQHGYPGGFGSPLPLWERERTSVATIIKSHCSQQTRQRGRRCRAEQNAQSLHRAFVVEAILIVLDDGGNRLERE